MKLTAIRAFVTFLQVGISVLIGGGIFSYDIATIKVAAVSGIGAGLSVIYNALSSYLNKTPAAE